MTQADRVHSTPRKTASKMNPPVDQARRHLLTIAAGGAVAAAIPTAVLAAAPNPPQGFHAVIAPDGKMIGRIMLPERCANLCFGGKKRNRLFMTASQSVYSLFVETQGVLGG